MLRIVYASFQFAFCVNFSSLDVWERPHMWTSSETPQRAAHLFGDRTNYGLADFVATTWDPREIEKKSIRKNIKWTLLMKGTWKSVCCISCSFQCNRNAAHTYRWKSAKPSDSARYVSHSRIVQCRGSSRVSRLFIQRNENCK